MNEQYGQLRTGATYENSVLLVDFHLSSTAFKIGVGTGYSAMKLPWVSLTLRVTPRLMVWRRRHALSTPLVDVETTEEGLPGWICESPYAEGSTGLQLTSQDSIRVDLMYPLRTQGDKSHQQSCHRCSRVAFQHTPHRQNLRRDLEEERPSSRMGALRQKIRMDVQAQRIVFGEGDQQKGHHSCRFWSGSCSARA